MSMPADDRPADVRRDLGSLTEAAVALFHEQGLSGLSFRLVAARAGVPLATVQRAFGTKEDMLREIFAQIAAATRAGLAQARQFVGVSPLEGRGLADFLLGVKSVIDLRPGSLAGVVPEMMMASIRTPALRPPLVELVDQIHAFWADATGDEELGWFVLELQLGLLVVSTGSNRPLETYLANGEIIQRALVGRAPEGNRWFRKFLLEAVATPPAAAIEPGRGSPMVDRILTAAAEIIVGEGVLAMSYRTVAARAQLPFTSIAHYFPNREALLYGAYRHITIELTEFARRMVARAAGTNSVEHQTELLLHAAFGEASSSVATTEVHLIASRNPALSDLSWYLRMTFEFQARRDESNYDPVSPESFDIHVRTLWLLGCGLVHFCRQPADRLAAAMRGRVAFGLAHLGMLETK